MRDRTPMTQQEGTAAAGSPYRLSRRRALTGIAGVGTIGAVAAACGSDPGSSTAGGDQSKDASGVVLAALSDIPVGQAVRGQDGDTAVLVAQPEPGSALCFNAKCTHKGCPVQPAGKELHCPCHGSVYDARTGNVIHGPAPKPLARIPVKVENGKVVTT